MNPAIYPQVRAALSSARHLDAMRRSGQVLERDFDRLIGKIVAGLEAAVVDHLHPTPTPEPTLPFGGDFDETLAKLRSLGVGLGGEAVGRLAAQESPPLVLAGAGPNRVRTVRGLGVIDGDR